jgi:hypothetical protein
VAATQREHRGCISGDRRLEAVVDVRELMTPFPEHHGKDAVGACLDWPSPNGMLADDSERIGRWQS